jgi:RluA family pseudouridine synthase
MIEIIFEDEALLVINKPSGLLSIADGYDRSLPHIQTLLEPEFGKLWMVHRLDKDTSGILILARSAKAHKYLNDQFSNREVQKQYFCLVFGNFPSTLIINSALKINIGHQHRTVIDTSTGKPASTDFSLLDHFSATSSLIAMPHTGYTHQIRAHLLFAGFPILCDPVYYSKQSQDYSLNLPLKRVALHAQKIIIRHPISQKLLTFSAEIPQDLADTIEAFK